MSDISDMHFMYFPKMAVDFIFPHFEKKDFGEKETTNTESRKRKKTRDRENKKKERRLEKVEE